MISSLSGNNAHSPSYRDILRSSLRSIDDDFGSSLTPAQPVSVKEYIEVGTQTETMPSKSVMDTEEFLKNLRVVLVEVLTEINNGGAEVSVIDDAFGRNFNCLNNTGGGDDLNKILPKKYCTRKQTKDDQAREIVESGEDINRLSGRGCS